jgi:hypothetical protein
MLLTQSICSIANVSTVWWSGSDVRSISHPNTIVCYLYIDFCCVVVTFRESGSGFWVDVTHYNFSNLKQWEIGPQLEFSRKSLILRNGLLALNENGCSLRFSSSGMFCHQGQVAQEEWTALSCFETSVSIYQSTWHNISEELHLQQYRYAKFK